MPADFTVPQLVLQRARANDSGAAWLAALPDVLDALAQRWGLVYGDPFVGGTAGLVMAADSDVGPCVVKVPLMLDLHETEAVHHAVLAHQLASGRGCAELLDYADDVPALLLEALGPNLHDQERSLDEVLDAVATTLMSFWQPVGADTSLMTGAAKAQWLASYIESTWAELDRPVSRPTIDQAIAFCDERAAAHDPASAVLCHGDAHGWNTLDAGDGTCKFVDPEGLVAEPAADLAVPMREYNEPLLEGDTISLTRARAQRLALHCNVDPEAIWQWGFIERVSTGLANLRDFGAVDAAPFLEVAERCAAVKPRPR